jgi:LCP family protein required for cell wall assembly
MSRNRIWVVVAVVAVVAVLCVCGAIVAYILWNAPLGAPLTGQTATSDPEIIDQPKAQASTDFPSPTPSPAPSNCGQSGSMTIMVLGVDSPFSNSPKGPLDIRFIKIDFVRKTAVVFSIPRDLWVPITGLESWGFTQARLGEAYLIAQSDAGYSAAAATNLLAQNLNGNFGVVGDHYITAKLTTLAAIIDTIGGITVTIPVAYDGTPYGLHYFGAGPYVMNGTLALEYALAPSPAAQWSALDRKNLVLQAVSQKIFSAEIIPKLPALIPQFLQVATTDLSMQQIMDLICISQQIPAGQVTVTGVAPGDVTYGAGAILYPNYEVIRAKVKQYLG